MELPDYSSQWEDQKAYWEGFIYETSSHTHIAISLYLFALREISQSLILFSEDYSEYWFSTLKDKPFRYVSARQIKITNKSDKVVKAVHMTYSYLQHTWEFDLVNTQTKTLWRSI